MGSGSQEAIKQLEDLMDQVDEQLKATFQNMHQGYPNACFIRFLKARDWNVPKAHKMLVDCLNWRIKNDIDNILAKPIVPVDLYRAVRDTQLIGMSGYTNEWLPVFAMGVGLSTYDEASVTYYIQSYIQMNEYRDRVILPAATEKHGHHIYKCLKVLDMTGLKISALGHIKLLTKIATVDDLNYPEKTQTYYVVNAPHVFSACWKVVKPLLHERTRKKVQVLHGSGRDELLKVMDYESLPHFCKGDNSGAAAHQSHRAASGCFSLDHPFHQQLYSYISNQSRLQASSAAGSFHVDIPEPVHDDAKIAQTIESQFHHQLGSKNGLAAVIE